MIGRQIAALLLCIAGASAQTVAEEPWERVHRLLINQADAKVSVVFDRALYFPCEVATVTVTTSNPTSAPLELFDPTDRPAQGFDIAFWWKKGFVFTDSLRHPPEATRSVILPPGGNITVTIHSEDHQIEPWVFGKGGMPREAYRYEYRWWPGGTGEFEVGTPYLEQVIHIRLHKMETHTPSEADDDQPATYPVAAIVMAVRMGSQHIIMVSMDSMPTTYVTRTNPDGTSTPLSTHAPYPWIRVAEVPYAIANLKAAVDGVDRIAIEYSGMEGAPLHVYLDDARHPVR